jgi:hypothetical protein
MIAGLAMSQRGQQQAMASTVEGARTQANIEAMNREYSQKVFDEEIEQQKPFYDAGVKAGVKYDDAITNKLDPKKTGTYQLQRELIDPDLAGQPEYVWEGAHERLGAMEAEKQKGRLMDLQQIGLGAAGSAGTAGVNLGNVLAQSYGLTGNVMAKATQSAAEQKQSMWNVTASQLSGLPSYFSASRPLKTEEQ